MSGVSIASSTVVGIEEQSTPDRSRDWRRLTISAALLVTVVEALLLQRKHGLFTGGFLSINQFGTWADGLAFMMVVLLLNATVVAPICAAAMLLGRSARLRPRALRFGAFAAGAAPLLAADFLMYQIWSYLGDTFDSQLMFELTGRRVSEMFVVAAPLVTRPLFVGILLVAVVVGFTLFVHRLQRTAAAAPVIPTRGAILRGSGALLLSSATIAMGVGLSSESMAFGLRRTPAGDVTLRLLDRLTDFDGDGYGLLRNPRDTAPFNASIHPYALEIPGNGIDENGLAGDLPLECANYKEVHPASAPWPSRPPVVLFVLESFRADAVGASLNGHAVTPVLNDLALQGARVDSAWSHNGFTRQSRFHILTGSLIGRDSTSLLDDFKDHGYDVAYFSAQDETAFGDPRINYDRVDKYYDAKQDVSRRYSTYTTAGSLAVPFNVVEERIGAYLQERRSTAPLFIYVNFHDTHYPYTHPFLKDLLGVESLRPSLISPARRGELWRTYLNAAANVDAAIGRVMDVVTISVGAPPAVVVIGDHGESLFDEGILGHGYALNSAQTRIPLIVKGLPLRIRTPFGQANLRDAVNDALTGVNPLDARPIVENGTGTKVFQYLGPIETPGQIGWLSESEQFTYDFRSNRVGLWDTTMAPADLVGVPKDTFADLVHYWESIQLAFSGRRLPEDPSH